MLNMYIFGNKNYLQNTLSKTEKLKKKKQIKMLFNDGNTLLKFPIRLVWQIVNEGFNTDENIKFGVSIPKSLFKNAVERNLLKRKIREAFRLNNHELKQKLVKCNSQIRLMFIYSKQEIMEYYVIDRAVSQLLQKVIKKIEVDI